MTQTDKHKQKEKDRRTSKQSLHRCTTINRPFKYHFSPTRKQKTQLSSLVHRQPREKTATHHTLKITLEQLSFLLKQPKSVFLQAERLLRFGGEQTQAAKTSPASGKSFSAHQLPCQQFLHAWLNDLPVAGCPQPRSAW